MKHAYIRREDGIAIIAGDFGHDPDPNDRASEIRAAVRATRISGVCLSTGCKLYWKEVDGCYLLSDYAADGSDVTRYLRLQGITPIQPQPRAVIAPPPRAQPRPRLQPAPVISDREVLLGVVSDCARSIRYRAPVKRIDQAARLA